MPKGWYPTRGKKISKSKLELGKRRTSLVHKAASIVGGSTGRAISDKDRKRFSKMLPKDNKFFGHYDVKKVSQPIGAGDLGRCPKRGDKFYRNVEEGGSRA